MNQILAPVFVFLQYQSRDGDVPKDVRATYTIQDIYEVYTILKDQAG